jgi:hypothetical protein
MGGKSGDIDLDVDHDDWNMLEGVRWVFVLFGRKGTSAGYAYESLWAVGDKGLHPRSGRR